MFVEVIKGAIGKLESAITFRWGVLDKIERRDMSKRLLLKGIRNMVIGMTGMTNGVTEQVYLGIGTCITQLCGPDALDVFLHCIHQEGNKICIYPKDLGKILEVIQ